MSDPTEYRPRIDIPMVTAESMQRIADALRNGSQGPLPLLPGDDRQPTVKFRRLPHGQGLPLPAYETADAAGIDLHAAEDAELTAYVVAVGTGFSVEIPPGYEGQIRPRSGWSLAGLVIANAPGTIDSDYRGELKLLVRRSATLTAEPLVIVRGNRIAQLVIAPVSRAQIVEAEALGETERGEGGFGSTGT